MSLIDKPGEPEPDSYAGLMKRGYWERAIQVADAMVLMNRRMARRANAFGTATEVLRATWAEDYWIEAGDRAWRALQLGYDDPNGRGWRV